MAAAQLDAVFIIASLVLDGRLFSASVIIARWNAAPAVYYG